MTTPPLHWEVPIGAKPRIALMAISAHGPHVTQRFRSDRWWLHLYTYTATLHLDGEALPIRPGCASLIPPATEVEYDFINRSTHLCAHFALSEDDGSRVTIPAIQNLSDDFPRMYQSLEEALACFITNPARAEVRLWDILWQLADPLHPHHSLPVQTYPNAVLRAREIIELRLGEPLSVKALAEEVGISHNHLTRLFRKVVGDTVIGYIHQRRVERAQHLLEHTTLPINNIAAQVGVEDSRLFYKIIRAHLGLSPTQIRQNMHAARQSESTIPLS